MDGCSYKKRCRNNCAYAVIISIIIGILTGVLFSEGLIPIALNFIKVSLVMSAISMALLACSLYVANVSEGCNIFRKCTCDISICLLVPTIGTLLAATAAATAGFVSTSIASIITVGLTAFFFAWLIFSLVSFFSCLIKYTCR